MYLITKTEHVDGVFFKMITFGDDENLVNITSSYFSIMASPETYFAYNIEKVSNYNVFNITYLELHPHILEANVLNSQSRGFEISRDLSGHSVWPWCPWPWSGAKRNYGNFVCLFVITLVSLTFYLPPILPYSLSHEAPFH